MRLFLLLAVIAAPVFATAQPDQPTLTLPGDVAAEGPSRVDRLLDAAMTPEGAALLLGALGSLLGGVVGTSAVRRRRVAKAVQAAYHLVEAVSSETPSPLDDKAAEGLKQLNRYLVANGWREATPAEKALAELEFKALHGEDKRAEKVAGVVS